jgi:hypothetical protein
MKLPITIEFNIRGERNLYRAPTGVDEMGTENWKHDSASI